MRMLAWVMDTVQGFACRSALLVSVRPSYSQAHTSSEASESSAGEMVRSAMAIHLSAWGGE